MTYPKDYKRIAELLNRAAHAAEQQHPPKRIIDALVVSIGEHFAAQNPQFDMALFCAEAWKGVSHG